MSHLIHPALDSLSPLLAVTESGPAGQSQVGIGAVVLAVAIAALLVWVAYLITSSRQKRRPEETPKNLQPWLSDDELESTRLTSVLGSAVVAAAVLAIVLPVYYLNESGRQADATESFADLYIHEGGEWFKDFECSICHGPNGGGGSAEFVEARSGLTVPWSVPSLNDVLYRYSEEEVRFWIEYGRPGTPMPPAGLAGGGAMTVQEVDQVIAYLREIQLPQDDAFGKVDGAVKLALSRIASGATTVKREILQQQAVIDDIIDAAGQFAKIEDTCADESVDTVRPNECNRVIALLAGDATCTDVSAALVGSSCGTAGLDSDRDGLTDEAERRLISEIASVVDEVISVRQVVEKDGSLVVEHVPNVVAYEHLYGLDLRPDDPFSMTDAGGRGIADLDSVGSFIVDLRIAHLTLSVLSERQERFLVSARRGLAHLEAAAAAEAWKVDFDAVAATTGLTLVEAERAAGLFNAYCARCHTAGYSAGVAFEQGAGSGAWGPALAGGRAVVQFPDIADHIDFITRGTQLGQNYGANGLGRGWMPGFGPLLSEDDIRLIALFERSL